MPTVLEVIKSTTAYFEKHGVESPRLNAEHLAAHALGKKKRLDLYLEFDRPLAENELAPLRPLVRERAQGKPLQHLLGTVEFYGREFLCDARALVPRPETERLLEYVIESKPPAGAIILDVGTGSGVIAITLALELPGSAVTAIDVSPDALALAAENAARLEASITFAHADLLPAEPEKFDLMVANLPYIPTGELAGLAREVQFDPRNALDGGADGLDLIRILIERSVPRLTPGARIFLEIGHDQSDQVAAIFSKHGYLDIQVLPDYEGVSRFVSAST